VKKLRGFLEEKHGTLPRKCQALFGKLPKNEATPLTAQLHPESIVLF